MWVCSKNSIPLLELFQLLPFKMHNGDFCCCSVDQYQLTVLLLSYWSMSAHCAVVELLIYVSSLWTFGLIRTLYIVQLYTWIIEVFTDRIAYTGVNQKRGGGNFYFNYPPFIVIAYLTKNYTELPPPSRSPLFSLTSLI